MNLQDKIIQVRKDNNLSQEEFAELIGVTRQSVSNWERGTCYPDIETLIIISNKFDISLDNLLKGDIKLIKTIDKKIKINKLFKYVLIILVLISALIILLLNQKHQKEIRTIKNNFANIQNENMIMSIDKNIITNMDDVNKYTNKIDLYISDHDFDYEKEKPVVTDAEIIKNDNDLIISLKESEYFLINKLILQGYNFIIYEK